MLQLSLGVTDRRSGRLSSSFQGQASSSRWAGGAGAADDGEGPWDSEGFGDSHSMVDGEDLDESEGPSDEGDSDADHMPLARRDDFMRAHRGPWDFY